MDIVWAVVLAVVALASWALNLVGMPGNWVIVASSIVYALLTPVDLRVSIGWPVVLAVAILALGGEAIEFAAGAAGARRAGGSKRAAFLALVGALGGALVGVFVGLPIPVVGSIVGALLFAACGALGGAMLGEAWAGRPLDQSWQVGKAAFWGRLLGTLGKILVGSIMVAVVIAALLI